MAKWRGRGISRMQVSRNQNVGVQSCERIKIIQTRSIQHTFSSWSQFSRTANISSLCVNWWKVEWKNKSRSRRMSRKSSFCKCSLRLQIGPFPTSRYLFIDDIVSPFFTWSKYQKCVFSCPSSLSWAFNNCSSNELLLANACPHRTVIRKSPSISKEIEEYIFRRTIRIVA